MPKPTKGLVAAKSHYGNPSRPSGHEHRARSVEEANPTHDRRIDPDGRAPRSFMTNAGRPTAENIETWSAWAHRNSPKASPHKR
jgi:hypothetical protein